MSKVSFALRSVLCQVGSNYNQEPYQRADSIIGLCGFYGSEAMPDDVKAELAKLNAQHATLYAFDKLLETFNSRRSNELNWTPFLRETPTHLTLSPTFNVQRGDDASIVAEIEKLRSDLINNPVRIDLLLTFISRKAREAGHLLADGEE